MFNVVIGILNAAGWLAYYYFSGGYMDDPIEMRPFTIASIIIVSIICSIISYCFKNADANILKLIWNNVMTSSFASSVVLIWLFPKSHLIDPTVLTFQSRLISLIPFAIAFFVYLTIYLGPIIMDIDTSFRADSFKEFILLPIVKFLIVIATIALCYSYPSKTVGSAIWGIGLFVSAIPSIILSIKNKLFY